MPVAVIPVSTFSSVTSVANEDPANQVAFKAAIQQLANRTEFNKDQAAVGPALAAEQMYAKRSSGIAEGKAASDFGQDVIALATAVLAGDAVDTKGANIASAGLTNIAAATGKFVHVTGTTTITGFGTTGAGVHRYLRFAGILILTHNATSMILPAGANITTAANDTCIFVSEGGGNWRLISYQGDGVTADAESLRGVNLELATVGSPNTGDLISFDGTKYVAALLTNANVATGALIDIAKLGPGSGSADEVVVINGAGTGVESSTLLNVHINASAAIAGSKIAPDFGSQDVDTTGNVTADRFNHATSVVLSVATASKLSLSATILELTVPLFQFGSTVVAPIINQKDETTNSVNGDTLLIHAQNSTGTGANGGALLIKSGTGTTNGGDVTIQAAIGSGGNNGSVTLLDAAGTGGVVVNSVGQVKLLPTAGQGVEITATGAGSILIDAGATGDISIGTIEVDRIESGKGATDWTHAGDFLFEAGETDPKIQVVAVVDAVGTSFSVLGQSNNSASNKAGDATFAAGVNAGAGDDGDTIIGNGIALFESDGVDSIAFFGGSVATKPTVTGSRGANAALASLLTGLAGLGLLIDSSS